MLDVVCVNIHLLDPVDDDDNNNEDDVLIPRRVLLQFVDDDG